MFQTIVSVTIIIAITVIIIAKIISNNKCKHCYKLIDKLPLVNENDERVGVCYVSRCISCGKVKYDKFKYM